MTLTRQGHDNYQMSCHNGRLGFATYYSRGSTIYRQTLAQPPPLKSGWLLASMRKRQGLVNHICSNLQSNMEAVTLMYSEGTRLPPPTPHSPTPAPGRPQGIADLMSTPQDTRVKQHSRHSIASIFSEP